MRSIALLALCMVSAIEGQQRVNADAALVETFLGRVNAYVKLRKTALAGMPNPAQSMKKGDILREQRAVAERIQAARPGAKQGDICSPDIAQELRRLIGIAMADPSAVSTRASLKHADSLTAPLKVGDQLPDRLPQPSTPPSLLINLPTLPPEVDYRIVGRALVLRDTSAGMIVDYVPNALPILQ